MENDRVLPKWVRPAVAVSVVLLLVASAIYFGTQMLGLNTVGTNRPTGNEPQNLPDLSVTSAGISVSDQNPVEGSKVTVVATVHNIGGRSSETTVVEFWDDVCEGCDGKYLIGTVQLDSIAPDDVRLSSVVWDTSGQAGDNFITVAVDSDNSVKESVESNNVATQPIHVEGLISESVKVTVMTPNGGEDYTGGVHIHSAIIWKLVDDGKDFDVHIYYSENAGLDWIFIHEGIYRSGLTDPNSTLSYDWTFPLVNTTQALVRVCATDETNTTTCDDSDRQFTIDSTKPRIISVDPPNGATDVPLDKPFRATFSEPMQEHYVATSFGLSPFIGRSVLIGWDSNVTVRIIHDPAEPHTTYTWGFSCWAVDKSWPGNSLKDCPQYFTFTTGENRTDGPDLTLTSSDIVFSDDNPTLGEIVTITAHIHNVGNQNAYNVTVDFVDYPGIMPPYLLIDRITIPAVPANSTASASVHWNATPEGTHMIEVLVDPFNVISETNEGNNNASRTIRVEGVTGVDLTLASSDIFFSDDTPDVGQLVTIGAFVHNIGDEDAYNVTVKFEDRYSANVTLIIGYYTIPYIGAGSVGNASIMWNATPEGLHTITVTIDPFNAITEANENNNVASRYINVGQPSPSGISVKATTFDNDNDGKYDDVVLLVYDSEGHAVEGAYVYIDGVFYGLTPETGILLAYNFSIGTHTVYTVFGSLTASTTFYSDGR